MGRLRWIFAWLAFIFSLLILSTSKAIWPRSVREWTNVFNVADVIKKRCPSGQANIENVIHNNSFLYRYWMQPCQILFYIAISSEILPRCYTCHFVPSYVAMWSQRLVSQVHSPLTVLKALLKSKKSRWSRGLNSVDSPKLICRVLMWSVQGDPERNPPCSLSVKLLGCFQIVALKIHFFGILTVIPFFHILG